MPSCPPVDPSRVVAALAPATRFRTVLHTPSTGSTNADMVALAHDGAAHGTLLVTEHQAAGRGRFQRAWEQVPGTSVAMSLLLRSDTPPARWGWLPLVAGLGVRDGIARYLGEHLPRPVLKWPNDVLVEDGPRPGKVCGILAERVETPQGPAAVVGVGINLAMAEAELPVSTATSLLLCGDLRGDASLLVAAVLDAWSGYYERWAAGEDLAATYQAACGTVGRVVRVQLDEQRELGPAVIGVAEGVDAAGSLLVRTGDGAAHALSAGDVLHLRT